MKGNDEWEPGKAAWGEAHQNHRKKYTLYIKEVLVMD